MPDPTNSDIMHLLGTLEEKVDENIALSKKTNGRVSRLEIWQAQLKAVADDRLLRAPIKSTGWASTDEGKKLLLAIAGLATAVGTYLVLRGGI